MTRDEIMALSGRELDAAVAEHVMGWTHLGETEGHLVGHDPQERQPYVLTVVPHYSTDIAAAWQVVERMRELRWHMRALGWHIRIDMHWTPRWRCVLYSAVPPCMVAATAPTVPEAICRATLLAVLGQSESVR